MRTLLLAALATLATLGGAAADQVCFTTNNGAGQVCIDESGSSASASVGATSSGDGSCVKTAKSVVCAATGD